MKKVLTLGGHDGDCNLWAQTEELRHLVAYVRSRAATFTIRAGAAHVARNVGIGAVYDVLYMVVP